MTAATLLATQDEPAEAPTGAQEPLNPTRTGERTPRHFLGAGPSLSASPLALACDALETAYWHLLGVDPADIDAGDNALFGARLVLLYEEQHALIARRFAQVVRR